MGVSSRVRKRVSLSFLLSTAMEVTRIACENGIDERDAYRLLVRLGIRGYNQGRGLFCGYDGCTRANCCGEIKAKRRIPQPNRRFNPWPRLLDLVRDDEPKD